MTAFSDEVIALRSLVQRQAKEIEELKERIRTMDAGLRQPPPFKKPKEVTEASNTRPVSHEPAYARR